MTNDSENGKKRHYPRMSRGDIDRLKLAAEEWGIPIVAEATGVSSSRIYDSVARGQNRSTGYRTSTIRAILNGLDVLDGKKKTNGGVRPALTTAYTVTLELAPEELAALLEASDREGMSPQQFLTDLFRTRTKRGS